MDIIVSACSAEDWQLDIIPICFFFRDFIQLFDKYVS